MNKYKLTFVAVIIGLLFVPSVYGKFTQAPHKAELAFAETSLSKNVKGSMVPASCSSSAYPNPQPIHIDYDALGYLETPELFHTEPYVSSCLCGNGNTDFPTCSAPGPQVSVQFGGNEVQPKIDSFSAPTPINYNTKPKFTWVSSNTKECRGNWTSGTLPTSGSSNGPTMSDKDGDQVDFTLRCLGTNNITWVEKTISVTSKRCTNCGPSD